MRTVYLALVSVLLAAVIPAQAHHEGAAYDRSHPVVLNGVVREFVWANPHAVLYVEVPNGSATDQWTLEGAAVSVLVRNGWTRNSLRNGDHVEVLVAPKRNTRHSGLILRVIASDGRTLSIDAVTPTH